MTYKINRQKILVIFAQERFYPPHLARSSGKENLLSPIKASLHFGKYAANITLSVLCATKPKESLFVFHADMDNLKLIIISCAIDCAAIPKYCLCKIREDSAGGRFIDIYR